LGWGLFLSVLGVLLTNYVIGEVVHYKEKLDMVERMHKELGGENAKVLNVGCKYFLVDSAWQVTNIDVAPRDVPNFVKADVRDLSMFEDKSFDAVFCSHVLEHLPLEDVEKAMNEMRRVVKDEKHIYILLPKPIFIQTWLHPEHHWVKAGSRVKNDPSAGWRMIGTALFLAGLHGR